MSPVAPQHKLPIFTRAQGPWCPPALFIPLLPPGEVKHGQEAAFLQNNPQVQSVFAGQLLAGKWRHEPSWPECHFRAWS